MHFRIFPYFRLKPPTISPVCESTKACKLSLLSSSKWLRYNQANTRPIISQPILVQSEWTLHAPNCLSNLLLYWLYYFGIESDLFWYFWKTIPEVKDDYQHTVEQLYRWTKKQLTDLLHNIEKKISVKVQPVSSRDDGVIVDDPNRFIQSQS
jgi:hypothetical protein